MKLQWYFENQNSKISVYVYKQFFYNSTPAVRVQETASVAIVSLIHDQFGTMNKALGFSKFCTKRLSRELYKWNFSVKYFSAPSGFNLFISRYFARHGFVNWCQFEFSDRV